MQLYIAMPNSTLYVAEWPAVCLLHSVQCTPERAFPMSCGCLRAGRTGEHLCERRPCPGQGEREPDADDSHVADKPRPPDLGAQHLEVERGRQHEPEQDADAAPDEREEVSEVWHEHRHEPDQDDEDPPEPPGVVLAVEQPLGDLVDGVHGDARKNHIIIIISALLGVSLLLAVSLCCYVLTRKTIKKNSAEDGLTKVLPEQKLQKSSALSCEIATETAHPFRLCDLEAATKNFENRIGSGGFGIVYYGKLLDGREIAVKVPTNDSYQGKKQFTNEVSLLSRIHHRNLVAFLGYCHEDGRNILVYEFMMNGTLKEHLHGRDKHISWIQRLEIAEDSAKGIEYLHSGCTPSIIHRDIKTSNILLDKQMRAKVSDFGLSKFVADESHASTNVRGTLGYLDPQYYTSQQLTEKSDIYSFGIILLELISGRPPISTMTFGEQFRNIGPWAKFYYESGDIEAIVDPTIAGEYHDVHSIWKIAETAVRCIDAEARRRPCMAEVVKEVQEAIALERPPSEAALSGRRTPFSPAGARSGAVRSHDMVMDNLLHDDSSFSETLKYPELR